MVTGPRTPQDDERTLQNARLFDAVAGSYDHLGFLTLAARQLVAGVAVQAGERVLDVATGTGTVALAVAPAAGPRGHVVGVDVAGRMLEVARGRAAGLPQVTFEQAEATRLPFPDGAFDRVLCASGLFFVPDMPGALREWRRVLRPGGQVAFTSFARGLLGPLPALWAARLAQEGVKPAAPPLGRLPTPEAAQEVLREAGFREATAALHALPYRFATPQARWAEIEAGVEGQVWSLMPPEQRERVRAAHLAELRELFARKSPTQGPLTVPVPVIVASGRAPEG
ncbi:hypothetical protein DEIPH_ctg103orf0058 [Deinococcus phoenicis]|uniref:Methyltransferase domain-containing protein n=1 Tax=Deinococcus phoenicis TaxID=1476583 RepID=A0A016QKH3_9DEIO|nr:methyltransferase domain-containing protein [Deinococcus phoenicis]EYB66528.1 hypothetical protein DEIPH_ctg103orf0058 [Deinococcus phoenicis]